jgi:low affinity Fe/Cu permease
VGAPATSPEPARREPGDAPQVRVPRDPQATAFDRFAQAASRFVSNGVFFTICLVVVVVWMPTLAIFSSVDTWQLVINTLTSVLAFLLIALLQNSERRYDAALHKKIDGIAAGLADLLENAADEQDRAHLRRHVDELRASVQLEGKV